MEEDELRFKVGDAVEIVGNVAGHYFETGESVTISKLCPHSKVNKDYIAEGADYYWWVSDKDIEKLNTQLN